MRYGSLFTGYGGLDRGLQAVIPGDTAWVSDIDAGPCKLLAHHHPDILNLGDISKIDFRDVEPVDIITGGFPCQDLSMAGRRAGLRPGTRSGLWSEMHRAIETIRPALVVAENVRGLLSAQAHTLSDVEPCPLCMGDEQECTLRALGAVLGDLADIGYDAWWTGVRAADAGAPHARFRVFVFAWPAADASSGELQRRGVGRDLDGATGPREGDGGERERDGYTAGDRGAALQDPDLAVGDQWRVAAPGQAEGGRARSNAGRRGGAPASDTDCAGLREHGRPVAARTEHAAPERGRHAPAVEWGTYAPAIHRWERVTGRPAPAPTEPGKTGQPRLSPAFVEWLMGLPDGHVTAVPGLTRNEQLKLLGNGVVPQQAALATRMWLESL